MMTEEEILQTVEQQCQEMGIYFQVFLQVPYLYIYINRETDYPVDYPQLTDKIFKTIAKLPLSDIQGISLHSRILGIVEPDWETYLELPTLTTDTDEVIQESITAPENNYIELEQKSLSPENERLPEIVIEKIQETNLNESSPEIAVEETPETILNESSPELEKTLATEVVEEPTAKPFELSKYCFTRNRSLLTATLPHPPTNIAKMVDFFHVLPNKQIVVSFLEEIFNTGQTSNTQNHPESIQQWVKEILALDAEKKRKASIWFSRYCLNPNATMEQVQAVLAIIAEQTPATTEKTPNQPREKTEPSLLTPSKAKPPLPAEKSPNQTTDSNSRSKTVSKRKKIPTWQFSSLHLAIAWIIVTVFAIMINFRTMSAALETSPLCTNSPASDECELAVQIVGAPAIELATKSHSGEPSERTKAAAEYEGVTADVYTIPYGLSESADRTCAFYGTIKAGMTFKEVAKMMPKPISTAGKIILPGVYFVDVQQNNFKGGSEAIRTACVFRYQETKQNVNVDTLAIEVIPTQWPKESYEATSQPVAIQKASGLFSTLSVLGTGTLFTAIGMFVAILLGLGIRANSLDTIFKASFFLGIIETLLSFLPIFFIAKIALETLALGLTSAIVKDFKVEWSSGYPVVAAGAIVIMGLRTLLNWIVFSLLLASVS
ncbi:phage holin family protein [Chroococcus sp. FPU101]|uniref:phage holin family protein n=1 Tax=Chroococcus sp. FPU101 TaxID=1974212 RepID=UPI001A8E858E|nr:phage holin family protein [Chroococcus sp. FPU101]GFE69520.1 hypothetical protein CFPU101_21300 [Chroococcus sp. FPU101]